MLGLPFEYKVTTKDRVLLNSINSSFDFSFKREDFQVTGYLMKKDEKAAFKVKDAGFSVFQSDKKFSVQIFALDMDGSADGIFTSLTVEGGNCLIVRNHPFACFSFISKFDIEIIQFNPKDESILASFEFDESAGLVDSVHLVAENMKLLSESFFENSFLVLKNFLREPEEVGSVDSWCDAGPSDYRNFKYENEESKVTRFMKSKSFMSWLSSLTGLPLLHPALPIYTKCIKGAGDYQILHGNYSEPFGVDVIYSSTSSEWPESLCGRLHYLNDSGTEILQVDPIDNSLTIVYRTEGCTRFTENVKGFPNKPLFQTMATYTVASEE